MAYLSRVLYPFAGSTRQDGARPDRWAGERCMAYFGHRPILEVDEQATERQTFHQPAKSSAHDELWVLPARLHSACANLILSCVVAHVHRSYRYPPVSRRSACTDR